MRARTAIGISDQTEKSATRARGRLNNHVDTSHIDCKIAECRVRDAVLCATRYPTHTCVCACSLLRQCRGWVLLFYAPTRGIKASLHQMTQSKSFRIEIQ